MLRKLRRDRRLKVRRFIDWGENDTFPVLGRNGKPRFNPDEVIKPTFALFPTMRAFQLARDARSRGATA